MLTLERTNAYRVAVGELAVLVVKIDPDAEKAYAAAHPEDSEGAANRAYYVADGTSATMLAVDYEYDNGDVAFLVGRDDAADAGLVEAVNGELSGAVSACLKDFNPCEGFSQFGDSQSGFVEVFREGDRVLLISGTQTLG